MPINTEPFETADGRIENIAICSHDTSRVWFRINGVPCWMDREEFRAFRAYIEAGGTADNWFTFKPTKDRIRGDFDADAEGVSVHAGPATETEIDDDEVAIDHLTLTDAPEAITDAIELADDHRPAAD